MGNKVERGSGTPNASSDLCVYTHMHTHMYVLAVFTGPCRPFKRHTSLMYTHVKESEMDRWILLVILSDFSVVYCENR